MTGIDEEYVVTEPAPFLQKAGPACFMSFDLDRNHEIEIAAIVRIRLSAAIIEVLRIN